MCKGIFKREWGKCLIDWPNDLIDIIYIYNLVNFIYILDYIANLLGYSITHPL